MSETAVPFLIAPRQTLDFFDERGTETGRVVTALEGWNLMRSKDMPLFELSMRLRDLFSAPFGVEPISGKKSARWQTVGAGQTLDFFHVDHISDHDLVLTVRDRHLDVMTWLSVRGKLYTVTSSVKVHNLFGKLYMAPVATAHKIIVATYLRRLRRLTATD
ncbi:DUF2867 domain-containing protein [Pannonibacter carbonis]|uniref:DUF2867 domain-containing protein n=1 Tax=Pannonibacter carbonis TaxID=2067569 RepID=UPI000D107BE1|nr:DUF2867 domain-containing protein [Pannonibacter carbonis]